MLKKNITQFIKTLIEEKYSLQENELDIKLFKEEKDYIEKHELLSNIETTDLVFSECSSVTRFEDAYIERSHKETEEVTGIETTSFLSNSIRYLKEHKEEFVYLESKWLELIGADALSLEVDDVFGTYDVMLGLKLQKKHENTIKNYLNHELDGDHVTFDLMYNQKDGMWDLNFTLDYIDGFNENLSFNEAFQLIYRFLFTLVENVEENVKS